MCSPIWQRPYRIPHAYKQELIKKLSFIIPVNMFIAAALHGNWNDVQPTHPFTNEEDDMLSRGTLD